MAVGKSTPERKPCRSMNRYCIVIPQVLDAHGQKSVVACERKLDSAVPAADVKNSRAP